MKKRNRIFSLVMAGAMALSMTACGSEAASDNTGAAAGTEANNAPAAEQTAEAGTSDGQKYTIGILQQLEHPALDAATQGFEDALTELLGADNVKFDLQNAQGEQANCATIANNFVASDYDLILANATTALQCAAAATSTIPILGTSVTDYATALEIDDWTGSTGRNISGTSDLAPLEEQEAMIKELIPDAKTVGVLYCSAESNSVLQADMAKEACKAAGLEAADYTVSSSNEIQTVVESMIGKVDVIYAPTDNMIAAGMATVAMIANENKIPIICGEEGMVKEGGLATYGINYYELGYKTGEMAAKILTEGADPASMPIEYLSTEECSLLINKETADTLGIDVSSYDADSLYTAE